MLIKYVRDDIAQEFFQNNVQMEKKSFFYKGFNSTWVKTHLHVFIKRRCRAGSCWNLKTNTIF